MNRFYVQWHVLDRCNLRCHHCYQERFDRENELDWGGLEGVAENLLAAASTWKVPLDVAITGGEPLLWPESLALLRHLGRSPQTGELAIITNGTLLERHLGELKGLAKRAAIRVSLDGATAEVHDAIRGRGVFESVCRAVKSASREGMSVLLMFTAMRSNLGQATTLLPLARSLGAAGVIVERFFPLGLGRSLSQEVLSADEWASLWQHFLDRAGCESTPQELAPFRGIKALFGASGVELFGSGCIVGRDGGAVMPDGTFLPCRRFPLPLGNLRRQSLVDIWESSPILKKAIDRSRLKGKCGRCTVAGCFGCRAMCHVLCGDYLAEDPHCPLL